MKIRQSRGGVHRTSLVYPLSPALIERLTAMGSKIKYAMRHPVFSQGTQFAFVEKAHSDGHLGVEWVLGRLQTTQIAKTDLDLISIKD